MKKDALISVCLMANVKHCNRFSGKSFFLPVKQFPAKFIISSNKRFIKNNKSAVKNIQLQ